ncbi:hypothetical protein TSMEX_004135 [Taenia solium]|eukprot:TsM_001217800 transcript=TsM_001217800 gene=TsM_001217800
MGRSLYTGDSVGGPPHFKDGSTSIYILSGRVPLILRALPQELLLAPIDAGIPADSGIDYCCEILSHLAIDQQEQSLARELFHQDQKAGENDEEHARNL